MAGQPPAEMVAFWRAQSTSAGNIDSDSDKRLAQEQIDEEKKRWEVGFGYGGFKMWVAREVDRLRKLSKSAKTHKRFSFLRKRQSEEPDYRELREEFRAFLRTIRDNVDLYLWFALSALAERNVDRKI